jgi:1-acyl-sn-glycerol-3-phosphate acyltransferase
MRKVLVNIGYIVFFWIFIPTTLIVSSLIIDRSITQPFLIGFELTGWIIAIACAAMLAISIIQFIKDTGELPVSAYPPDHIVRKGIYAFYRHPIYLFYVGMLVGVAFIIQSLGMFCIVLPVFIGCVGIYVWIEERGLLRRFGNDYQAYKEQAGLVIPKFHMLLYFPLYVLSKIFFPITVTGKGYMPTKAPFFLVANHRNYLDPFFVAFILPYRVHYVTTYEMFRSRMSAYFFKLLGCIPKKRYLHDITTVRRIMEVLKKGGVIGIFPEGERSYTGELLDLKPETIKLLQKFHEVPILPVSISGDYIMWPRWGKGWRRCRITMAFHGPIIIQPGDTVDKIQAKIKAHIKPDDTGISTAHKRRACAIECFLYRCPVCRKFDCLWSRDDRISCQECGHEWYMQEAYTLVDSMDGAVMTINEIYNRLRITHADIKEPQDILSGVCQCFVEKGVCFKFIFSGRVQLHKGILTIRPDDISIDPIKIRMHDLMSATIEGNRKLQVYDNARKQAYQFVFDREAARKWQDYIAEVRYAVCSEYPIVR